MSIPNPRKGPFMKKSILILFAVIACVMITVPVFAADITANTQIGSVTFQPSTNVHLNTKSNDQNGTPPNVYGVIAWHTGAVNQDAGYEFGAYSSDSIILRSKLAGVLTVTGCTGAFSATSTLEDVCPAMDTVLKWTK